MSYSDFNPLTCDPFFFLAKNSTNSAKSNRIFPRKERGDRASILTYLDSQMVEVFPQFYLFISISAIFKGKRGFKVGSEVQTLGPSFFHKTIIVYKIFQSFR